MGVFFCYVFRYKYGCWSAQVAVAADHACTGLQQLCHACTFLSSAAFLLMACRPLTVVSAIEQQQPEQQQGSHMQQQQLFDPNDTGAVEAKRVAWKALMALPACLMG